MSDPTGGPGEALCLAHGKPIDDHTIRELRTCHPANELNQPFEATEETQVGLEGQGTPCGGVVVRGLVLAAAPGALARVGLPDAIPTLGWQFFAPDGVTEVGKFLLPLDVPHMKQLRATIGSAIDRSILLSRRAR